MPRYYLPSPAAEGATLRQKGQVGSYPIYHCQESGTFWILRWNLPNDRSLVRYYPDEGKIDPNDAHPLPTEWDGEPQTISVVYDIWMELCHPGHLDHSVDLQGAIRQHIEDGDILLALGIDNDIIGQIHVDGDGFDVVPI